MDVTAICSHSRDVVGVYQNLNGSHDLTTPLSGMVCHLWCSAYYLNLHTKFEVYIYTHYK